MAGNKAYRRLEQRIQILRSENEDLCDQIDSLNENLYYAENAVSEANYRAERADKEARTAYYEREETERACRDKAYERQSAVHDLEHAKSWGDEWGIDRAMRKLKNL